MARNTQHQRHAGILSFTIFRQLYQRKGNVSSYTPHPAAKTRNVSIFDVIAWDQRVGLMTSLEMVEKCLEHHGVTPSDYCSCVGCNDIGHVRTRCTQYRQWKKTKEKSVFSKNIFFKIMTSHRSINVAPQFSRFKYSLYLVFPYLPIFSTRKSNFLVFRCIGVEYVGA